MSKGLIIDMEQARIILKNALNRIITEKNLPAFLIEGILLDLLAETRAQKAVELTVEYENTMRKTTESATPPKREEVSTNE